VWRRRARRGAQKKKEKEKKKKHKKEKKVRCGVPWVDGEPRSVCVHRRFDETTTNSCN